MLSIQRISHAMLPAVRLRRMLTASFLTAVTAVMLPGATPAATFKQTFTNRTPNCEEPHIAELRRCIPVASDRITNVKVEILSANGKAHEIIGPVSSDERIKDGNGRVLGKGRLISQGEETCLVLETKAAPFGRQPLTGICRGLGWITLGMTSHYE